MLKLFCLFQNQLNTGPCDRHEPFCALERRPALDGGPINVSPIVRQKFLRCPYDHCYVFSLQPLGSADKMTITYFAFALAT